MAEQVNISGVSTSKDLQSQKRISIVIQYGDGTLEEYNINEQLLANKTETQVTNFILVWAANKNIILPEFHVHKNDDGSWAIAIGADPIIWPEDEQEH